MAKIACPGCKKSYEVPASAAGRVATCKACGKKFRLGGKPVAKRPAPASKPKPQSAPEPARVADTATKPSDSFWDDAIDESFEVEQPAAALVNSMVTDTLAAAEAEANKPVTKVRWGFDWTKVAGGLATMVLAGLGAVAVFTSIGHIKLTAVLGVVAFGGLFTAISGLMGEEGIW